MTIEAIASELSITATAGQTDIAISFRLFDTVAPHNDLVVTVGGVATTAFTVTLNADQSANPGGTVKMNSALSAGQAVVISRRLDVERISDFASTGPVPMDTVNLELDRHIAIMQDLDTLRGQVLRVPIGESIADIPAEATRAGKALGFNSDGDPVALALAFTTLADGVLGTIAELKAISAPSNGQIVYVAESGKAGWFQFSSANLSSRVTTDSYEGLTVPPSSDTTGASGAWLRLVSDHTYQLSWFGFTEANAATCHLRWRTLEDLLVTLGVASARRVLPAGTFTGFATGLAASTSAVYLKTPGEVYGHGNKTVIDPNWTASAQTGALLAVHASDIEIHHLKFSRMQNDGVNADSFECINVGSRHSGGATAAITTDRISLHDLSFDDCDSPIRAIRSTWASGVFTVPTHLHIYNIHMTNVGYQGIVPWCDDVNIHDFYIHMKAGVSIRPFHCPFRVIGCERVRIADGRIQDDVGVAAFKIMRGGVDSKDNLYGAQYADAEDVHIDNVHMSGIGSAFQFLETSGNITVDNCSYRANPASTTADGTHFTFGSHGAPMRNSTIQVIGGIYTGTGAAIYFANSNFKRATFQNVLFVGNNSTPGGFSGPVIVDNTGTDALGNALDGLQMLELDGCRFLYKDSGYAYGVTISAPTAGTWFSARNCVFPYGVNVGAGNDIARISGALGTIDGATTNRAYIAGLWAEQVADFATNPRTGEY